MRGHTVLLLYDPHRHQASGRGLPQPLPPPMQAGGGHPPTMGKSRHCPHGFLMRHLNWAPADPQDYPLRLRPSLDRFRISPGGLPGSKDPPTAAAPITTAIDMARKAKQAPPAPSIPPTSSKNEGHTSPSNAQLVQMENAVIVPHKHARAARSPLPMAGLPKRAKGRRPLRALSWRMPSPSRRPDRRTWPVSPARTSVYEVLHEGVGVWPPRDLPDHHLSNRLE